MARDIRIRIEGDDDGWKSVAKRTDDSMDAIDKKAAALGGKFTSAGRALGPLSAGLMLAGGVATKFATQFNAGMANVATLIPGNIKRVNELKVTVQNLAIATGKSTEDLSNGLYQTISAFGDTADTAKILEINARAAAAGLAETTDAINLTSAVTKGYGDTSAAAVQQASDLALMTVRLGQTTFPELAASMGKVIPIAQSMGQSQEDLFAVFATATGVTGSAAEVATQYRGVLASLLNPTEDLTKLIKQQGFESGQAMLEQKGLVGTLQAITGAAEATGKPLTKYIASIEAVPLALALAGPQADNFAAKQRDLANAAGATDAAFKEQAEGVNAAGFRWEQMQQRMVVAAQRIGDKLMPMLERLGKWGETGMAWVEKAIGWFSALPQPVQDAALAIAAIAAISAPTLMAIGVGLNAVSAGLAAVGVTSSTAAVKGIGATLAMFGGPAAIAIAGVGAAFLVANSDMKTYQAGVEAAHARQKDWTLGLTQYGKGLLDIKPGALDALNAIGGLKLNLDTATVSTKAAVKPVVELTEAQKKYNEEIQKTAAIYTGAATAAEIKKLTDVLKASGGAANLSVRAYADLAGEAFKLKQAGGQLTPELARMIQTLDDAKPAGTFFDNFNARVLGHWRDMKMTLPGVTADVNAFMDAITPRNDEDWRNQRQFLPLDEIKTTLNLLTGEISDTGVKAGEGFKAGVAKALEGLGGVIVSAFQGGGDIGKSIGASLGNSLGMELGKKLTEAIGGSLGKMIGGFAGPLGALLGGKIGGFVQGLFGGNDTKKAREQAAQMLGFSSPDALYNELRGIGTDGAALVHQALNVIGKKDMAAHDTWFASVKALLEAQKVAADEAATAVESAAQREQDAINATRDALQGKLDVLQAEHDQVFNSIRAELEAPEYDDAGNRIYGVIEAQGIARLEEIEKQKVALQEQMEAAGTKLLDTATLVRDGIAEMYRIPIEIPYSFTQVGPMPGLDGRTSYAASGGYVTPQGVHYFDSGGWVPRGTDTVKAMLTPGEMVLPPRSAGSFVRLMDNLESIGNVSAAPSHERTEQRIVFQVGEDVILDTVIKGLPRRVNFIAGPG